MLVIISDLHLTDGTSGQTINEKAFRIFRSRVSDMAYDASWRKPAIKEAIDPNDPSLYRPIDEINILLLGDIIDMIRSQEWSDEKEINMPWTKDRGDAFYDRLDSIADKILEQNKKSFQVLKGLTQGHIRIPKWMEWPKAEDLKDKIIASKASEEKVEPKVNIYYMVGNHDWFLSIDNERMNNIRNRIIDDLGLCNEKNKPFPFYAYENDALSKTLDDHSVYAIHGDVFDETNYQNENRDGSSIGDVVVIKLLNEIPVQINKNMVNYCQQKPTDKATIDSFIKELNELDNLRPYSLAAQWISHLITKYELDEDLVNDCIRESLQKIVTDFKNNPIIHEQSGTVFVMGILSHLLRGKFNIRDLADVIERITANKNDFETYRIYAEQLSKERLGEDKSFFVMGHTHFPEIVPMSTFSKDDHTQRRIYLNTGTWRNLQKKGVYDNSFISYKTMTLAGFFKGDERGGHSFELWTGSLDM
ncbi:MAG: hypothetical protein QM737_03775 [Ferruginibacter sp.]